MNYRTRKRKIFKIEVVRRFNDGIIALTCEREIQIDFSLLFSAIL